MEDKKITNEEEQPVVEKKFYVPPTLTVYGKLSELTAGGSPDTNEPGSSTATGYYLKRP